MKSLLQKFAIIILVLTGISAKTQQSGNTFIPYKSLDSPVYGTDILIHANPGEDQRHTKIVVASNGYLYAAYLISSGGYRVARSTDNGNTWTISALQSSSHYLNAVDITVTGADTSTMNVWVVSAGYMKNAIDIWNVTLEKLDQHMNSQSSTLIEQFFSNFGFADVAIANDFAYPSGGTSPFSVAILYSKILSMGGNTQVIFKSSADGGLSFTNTRTFVSAGSFYINVALAFGRSPSLPEGRYFAAWDQQPFFSYYDSYFGKILTAHTLSQFNGDWSSPYELDTIGGGFTNGAKDPSIACQADLVNNGSNSFSVVVMYNKKLNASGSQTSAYGVKNLNPVAGSPWAGTFSSGTGNIRDIEPDVTYDPSHHKFYTTWSDSLTAKLKCSLNDIDLQTGGAWTLFYDGYNDGTNISNPFPKVKVNPVSQEVIHVWDGDLTATRTNATFDKSYVPVGVQDAAEPSKFSFNVSPNPSQGQADISFSLSRDELVYANLYDLSGRQVFAIAPQNFSSGNHRIRLNADQLEPACYIVQLHCGSVVATQRMIIIR